MLDQGLEWAVSALPTLFAVALALITNEIRKDKRRFWAVWAFGVIISVLTAVYIHHSDQIHNEELRKSEQKQDDLRGKLDQSLLQQQYTKGQLDSLALMVGRVGQPGLQGTELAAAIKQMSAQNKADLEASNSDLCKPARQEAQEIRTFQQKYDADERALMDQEWTQAASTTTDQQRKDFFEARARRLLESMQTHENEFRSRYVARAKYLRDLLINRIPPKTAELLIQSNSQSESSLNSGMLSGASIEYVLANYLDELANTVCPETPGEKKARQKLYHTIATDLHDLGTQGEKLHERCGPNSSSPPPAPEVMTWIDKANRYVRSTQLQEYLKNEFESEGPTWNIPYRPVAPGCEFLTGKIITKTSEIRVLENYLESQQAKMSQTKSTRPLARGAPPSQGNPTPFS